MLFRWLKSARPKGALTYNRDSRRSTRIRLHIDLLEDRWCPSTAAVPHVTLNPTSLTVDSAHVAVFTAGATGTPAPSVQWKISRDGGAHFTDIAGADSTTLHFLAHAGDNGDEFEAVFTNRSGKATTTAATLTVDYAPDITKEPANQRVAGGTRITLVAAARGNPAVTVQWQVSTDHGHTFTNVPGAVSPTLVLFTPVTGGLFEYRAVFTNSVGTATTRAAVVRVHAPPVVTTNPSSISATPGQQVKFTATASGFPVPHVQWQVSTDGGKHFHDIAGATSNTLNVAATTQANGYEYRAVFTNRFAKATSSVATLTVAANSAPAITTQPVDENATTSAPVILTAGASGSPTPTVQWQITSNGGTTFFDIPGATSATYSFQPDQAGVFQYRAVFTNSLGTATTNPATLHVTGGIIVA
jgi:hypothetical protein